MCEGPLNWHTCDNNRDFIFYVWMVCVWGVFSEVHFLLCTPPAETVLIHSFPRRKAQFLYMNFEHSRVQTSQKDLHVCASLKSKNFPESPNLFANCWFPVPLSLSLLLAQPVLYWCSRNISVWSNVSFNLAVLMNLLVCFFYPLEGVHGGQSLTAHWRLAS